RVVPPVSILTCPSGHVHARICPLGHVLQNIIGVDMADSRAVLITGSTGGIGAATVDLLRRRGFTVYAGARGPAAFGEGVHVVPLDVAYPESVAAAAKRIAGEVDGLRAVVNNAGVIVQGPLELVPADEWRRQLEVNTLGPASVVRE